MNNRFRPKADFYLATSRKTGKQHANIRIVCGERAITFDPVYTNELIEEVLEAHKVASGEKERLIKEAEENYG